MKMKLKWCDCVQVADIDFMTSETVYWRMATDSKTKYEFQMVDMDYYRKWCLGSSFVIGKLNEKYERERKKLRFRHWNLQVSGQIFDIHQHWIYKIKAIFNNEIIFNIKWHLSYTLAHMQIVSIHQKLHQLLIQAFDLRMKIVDDNLQLCDIHIG